MKVYVVEVADPEWRVHSVHERWTTAKWQELALKSNDGVQATTIYSHDLVSIPA